MPETRETNATLEGRPLVARECNKMRIASESLSALSVVPGP